MESSNEVKEVVVCMGMKKLKKIPGNDPPNIKVCNLISIYLSYF